MSLLQSVLRRALASPLASRISKSRLFSVSSQNLFAPLDTFARRHLGPRENDMKTMLKSLGFDSLEALIQKTVPSAIRSPNLKLQNPRGENELLADFRAIMDQNKVHRSFIGCGYYGTITPPVILRNMIENPVWYTAYTPYQAEISQGRMEMLLNYQTMVTDLTGLPVSNASLLDEATAAAEAMYMAFSSGNKKKNVFLVSDDVHPQTIGVVKTRAEAIDVVVKVMPHTEFDFSAGNVCGVLVQYPNTHGKIIDYGNLPQQSRSAGAMFIVASDLLALTVLRPPGEWGADCVVGSAQRFGVPLGFGGPHAAFMATTDEHKRKMPGRVIGVSRDSRGQPALRMAMQTREQHIRREKATSNICTSQALLANVAVAYSIWHGPDGLKDIATRTHGIARVLANGLVFLGYQIAHQDFFDTIQVKTRAGEANRVMEAAEQAGLNFRYIDESTVNISMDETSTAQDVDNIFKVFASVRGTNSVTAQEISNATDLSNSIAAAFRRASAFLTHPVFNLYHSETEMLRYLHKLSSKDLTLATAMIPLGSCTMKLNATSEMIPVTWPSVNSIHPFAPPRQVAGYQTLISTLERDLCEVTGFHAISFQPNAGSQGEYTGLLVIRAYHESRGDAHRNVCLIPTSAHGTNPASAALAGFRIVVVSCDSHGNIDVADLRKKIAENKENLACLMVTYPSTHGVFEESIREICSLVHEAGGQVYMDGANMNAQCGLTSPGTIGADVCHLNLHKTFCIPHGGGGPGMGPIGVAKHLAPFLPTHPVIPSSTSPQAIGPVAAAPYASASILPISWMYLKLMGGEGITKATQVAILNANYMATRLAPHYKILYRGSQGNVAHEFIIDMREIKAACGITEEDIAKRLMDFNFHAPTMSFPVAGTLMIEPTESESKEELDRFCDAMICIRQEIKEVEEGKADRLNNPLKGAPHTADMVLSDSWNRPYSREKAAYPLAYLRQNKFWPSVGRIDNVYGDRNLICTCPPISAYEQQ